MIHGLAKIGLEGVDTAGCTSRQHPPAGDLDQQDLGLEGSRFLGELASFRGLDEFLHVGRQFFTVGEQQGAAFHHLIDGLTERESLGLQILDVLHEPLKDAAPLVRYRQLGGRLQKFGRLVQPLLGFRERVLVTIERIAQDRPAACLQFGRDFAGPYGVGGLYRQQLDLVVNFSQLPHPQAPPGLRRTARARQSRHRAGR